MILSFKQRQLAFWPFFPKQYRSKLQKCLKWRHSVIRYEIYHEKEHQHILHSSTLMILFMLLSKLLYHAYRLNNTYSSIIVVNPQFLACLSINHSTSCSLDFNLSVWFQSSNGAPNNKSYQHNQTNFGRISRSLTCWNKLINLFAKACWLRRTHSLSSIPSSIGW